MSLFTSSTQSCPAFVENLQNLTIIDAKGNVIIENVHWDQMSTVKSACLNSNIANVDSKSKIQVLQKKFVKTVMTNFPGLILTDVQNLTSEVVSNMTTLFQQNCAVHVLNQQKVYLRNVKNVVFTYVQWDQTIAAILQCVQSKVYGTDAYQSLARMLGEVVPPPPPTVPVPTPDDGLNFAELLQTWGWVLVPVAVGVFLTVGMGWPMHGKFFAILLGLTFLVLGAGKFWMSWPYTNPEYEKTATKTNNTLMGVFFGLAVVLLGVGAFLHNKHQPLHKKLGVKKRSSLEMTEHPKPTKL
jgi:hypothetical protein